MSACMMAEIAVHVSLAPMVHINDNGIGTLIGAFSWGGGCHHNGNVVYAKVKHASGWIRSTVNQAYDSCKQ